MGTHLDLQELVTEAATEMQNKIPEIRDAMLVSIIEANLDAMQASQIALYMDLAVMKHVPVVHMMHDAKHSTRKGSSGRGYGIFTTPDLKFMSVNAAFQALRYGKIKFHRDLVSVGQRWGGQGTPAKNISETLLQLSRFSKVGEEAKMPWNKDKTGYTGKLGGLQDDLAIVILLLNYCPTLFYTKAEYASARNGIRDGPMMVPAAAA